MKSLYETNPMLSVVQLQPETVKSQLLSKKTARVKILAQEL